jgi:hypothetical protein
MRWPNPKSMLCNAGHSRPGAQAAAFIEASRGSISSESILKTEGPFQAATCPVYVMMVVW